MDTENESKMGDYYVTAKDIFPNLTVEDDFFVTQKNMFMCK